MKLFDAIKTGKKIRNGSTGVFVDPNLCCGFSVSQVVCDLWETEPEMYEVECTWLRGSGGEIVPTIHGWSKEFRSKYSESLVKKRTKLTIEVLD